jgi:hypothetical protein
VWHYDSREILVRFVVRFILVEKSGLETLETLTLSYSTVGVPCSSQFAENVSPRSNRLVHGAPPSMNEPVRSVLHELTGANCAQTKVTITLIAK